MKKHIIALGICLGGLVATGCYERHYYPPQAYQPAQVISAPTGYVDPNAVVVNQTPPPVQPEVIPPAPGPGYSWSPGHWEWNGGGWVWIGGVWVAPPSPGLVYVAPGWERHPNGGWVYHRGHWRGEEREEHEHWRR